MSWLKNLIMSRYVKSAIRYAIVALVVYLNKDLNLPYLKELSDFLNQHAEGLTEAISVALIGWVGSWSFIKNHKNAEVEKIVHKEVK